MDFICDVACAAVVLPLFDTCQRALDKIFDVSTTDTTMDGHALVLRRIAQHNCVAASSMLLVKLIANMETDGCNLNMAGVVAKGVAAASTTAPTKPTIVACKDDDAGMRTMSGFSCKQMKTTSCAMIYRGILPSLCTCSCPRASVHRTLQVSSDGTVGYLGGTSCTLRTFDDKLTALNLNCCNKTDKDDKCVGGVPFPGLVKTRVGGPLVVNSG